MHVGKSAKANVIDLSVLKSIFRDAHIPPHEAAMLFDASPIDFDAFMAHLQVKVGAQMRKRY